MGEFCPRHAAHVAAWRFDRHQLAQVRRRRIEAQSALVGLAALVVAFWVALHWHTLVTVAAFSVAAM